MPDEAEAEEAEFEEFAEVVERRQRPSGAATLEPADGGVGAEGTKAEPRVQTGSESELPEAEGALELPVEVGVEVGAEGTKAEPRVQEGSGAESGFLGRVAAGALARAEAEALVQEGSGAEAREEDGGSSRSGRSRGGRSSRGRARGLSDSLGRPSSPPPLLPILAAGAEAEPQEWSEPELATALGATTCTGVGAHRTSSGLNGPLRIVAGRGIDLDGGVESRKFGHRTRVHLGRPRRPPARTIRLWAEEC
jgi:hypothetical protein